jgi:2-polyprenyl-6-methoxyphenol hydroxylase-like FAD-dependent oxidoreductase
VKILVVGGGIGGLAFAARAARTHAVEIVDCAPEWRPLGAGILLHPNAMAAIDAVGADVRSRAAELTTMTIAQADGSAISRSSLAAIQARFGGTWAIHRSELHDALVEAVPDDVTIRLGTSVASLHEDEHGVDVGFTDGTSDRFGLVVGADGIHSVVRRLVLGDGDPGTVYSGYTCWRAVVPVRPGSEAVEMWGRGRRFGIVALPGDRAYAFLVANAPAKQPSGGVVALRRDFGGFGGDAPAVLAALTDGTLLHHDIDELPGVVWGSCRAWLLGDAAHAMTPNFGQGAAQALEDAVVASGLLADAVDPTPVFPRYVAARDDRAVTIQRGARRFGVVAQWESPAACWLRALAVRLTPQRVNDRFLADIVGPGVAAVAPYARSLKVDVVPKLGVALRDGTEVDRT